MSKKYRVKAERTFQGHTAGDVLLVEATPEIEVLVKSKLFTILSIEGVVSTKPDTPTELSDVRPVKKPAKNPKPKKPAKTAAKKKAAKDV